MNDHIRLTSGVNFVLDAGRLCSTKFRITQANFLSTFTVSHTTVAAQHQYLGGRWSIMLELMFGRVCRHGSHQKITTQNFQPWVCKAIHTIAAKRAFLQCDGRLLRDSCSLSPPMWTFSCLPLRCTYMMGKFRHSSTSQRCWSCGRSTAWCHHILWLHDGSAEKVRLDLCGWPSRCARQWQCFFVGHKNRAKTVFFRLWKKITCVT